jgi:FkbM family methyltransferase
MIKRIIKKLLPKKLRGYIEKKFKKFYAANSLDIKMLEFINYDNGYYIEVGANDGIRQSNTLYFEENKTWKGLLIEPLKDKFLQLKKNRSAKNAFENCALVSNDYKKKNIELSYSDLMTATLSNKNTSNIKKNLIEGRKHLNIFEKEKIIKTRVSTLNNLLIKNSSPKIIDFFSLDVEGFEMEVLKGVDFKKYKFRFILVECIGNFENIKKFLVRRNYVYKKKLSNIDYLFNYKNEL